MAAPIPAARLGHLFGALLLAISAGSLAAAPLALLINGGGTVCPLTNGEALNVGQTYSLVAIPEPGFAFESWQPVNVFTFTLLTVDTDGNTNVSVSVDSQLVPAYTNQPWLDFRMEPTDVVYDTPTSSLTESSGWQANFAPVLLNPQPADGGLILTWTNPAYTLQAAPAPLGPYADVPGAVSPYTNPICGPAQYFRLAADGGPYTNSTPAQWERLPYGWSDWGATTTPYWQTIDPTKKNATTITNWALTMATNGLLAAGWNVIAIDAGWAALVRDTNGNLQASSDFPDMPGLISWLHSLGFYVNLYLSRGPSGCLGVPMPGSLGREARDMALLGSWGVDAVKLDECPGPFDPTAGNLVTWDAALNPPNTPKPIYSIWTLMYLLGTPQPWPAFCNCPQNGWGEISTTLDGSSSNMCWVHCLAALQDQLDGIWDAWGTAPPTPEYYGPYYGKQSSGVYSSSPTNICVIGFCILHSMLANPPLMDFPPTNNLALWTNREIIAIGQDEAQRQGYLSTNYANGVTEYVKVLGLPEKCRAVALLNTNLATVTMNAPIPDMGYLGTVSVRDVVNHAGLGTYSLSVPITIPPASCVMWIVAPVAGPQPALSRLRAGRGHVALSNGGSAGVLKPNTE